MDDLSLHVLDADGRVVRTLGAPWDPARLDLPADAVIDGLGRVCVRDGRTGAIHVFDAEGRLLFVARMAPEDGDARHAFGRVALRPDGGILVEQAGCAVRFDAAGERIGQAPRAKCSIFLELPGTRFVHGSHFEPLTLLDASGAVIAVHDKAPDGRWFRDPRGASLSADGRAALLMQESIVLLDAEGRLQRAIALPERPWYGSRISMGRKRILVAGTRPEALVYSSVTANWERVVVGPHEPGARWSLGLTADGTEILALDQRTWELHRVPLAGD